ncbi:MAG: sensor histidine kinase [Gammaproteobacteria bacterium]|nr:sensor histidine kinase [Gammaproteobacteria bacterium]
MKRVAKQKLDAGDVAALITIAAVYIITVYLQVTNEFKNEPHLATVTILFLIYTASFLLATRESLSVFQLGKIRSLFLCSMVLAAFGLLWILRFDFLAILTIIWAAVLAYFLTIRWAFFVSLLVVIAWFGLAAWVRGEPMWIQGVLYGTFHMFALLLAMSNHREKAITLELRQKNDQLIATQALLSDLSRQSERTRIARELHDLVGHHLTGLTIKLQVAERLSDDTVKLHIQECHSIAKLLLNDVRDAVDSLRTSEGIDLKKSLNLMVQNVPRLAIHLKIDNNLSIEDSQAAQAIFRCVQEAVTNSLRHSNATDLWVEVTHSERSTQVNIWDNGRLLETYSEGNGLTGMRERVEQLAGSLVLKRKNNALHYSIELPKQ